MTGLNKYSDKEKRKMRIQNHVARDLRTPKYKQRVVKPASRQKPLVIGSREWYEQFDDDDEDTTID